MNTEANIPVCIPIPAAPRGTREFCREKYKEDIYTPPYWTHFTNKRSVKDWKADPATARNPCVLIDVDDDTERAVRNLMYDTWWDEAVGYGRDARGLAAVGFEKVHVVQVQRIENIDLYEKYALERQRLFHKSGEQGVFCSLESCTNSTGAVLTTEVSSPGLLKDTFTEINEHFVFHGTKPERMKVILRQGLDNRMTGDSAMFGLGVYGAESSTKADQYVGTYS